MRIGNALALFGLVAVGAVTSHIHHNGRGHLTRDKARVEAAAQRIPYDQIADAWTRTKLGDNHALDALRGQVGVRPLAAHEAAGAIVLVFASHSASRDVCLDLIAYREGNTVRTRRC